MEYKQKYDKYLYKLNKHKKQNGGFTPEMYKELIEIRKLIYSNAYDEKGELIDLQQVSKEQILHDLEICGDFFKKNHIDLKLYIGVTNSKNNNSDYARFNGMDNTMVVQNNEPINIFNCSPIAFYIDIKQKIIIDILVEYFRFSNIIFDWSTAKFFAAEELALPYDKLLLPGGSAFFDLSYFGGLKNIGLLYRDFKKLYLASPSSNNLPETFYKEYITTIKDIGRSICNSFKFKFCDDERFLFDICAKINDNIGKTISPLHTIDFYDKSFSFHFDIKKFNFDYFGKITLELRRQNINEYLIYNVPQINIEFIENSTYPIPKFNDIRDDVSKNFFKITHL